MKKIFIVFAIASLLFLSFSSIKKIYSAECSDRTGDDKINCLRQLIDEGNKKASSLNAEIKNLDNQLLLTETQINITENKIVNTQKELDILGTRIEGLDNSLDYISKVLLNKIVEGYKQREVSLFSLIFDSKNADDLLSKIKYVKTARNNNQKLLVQVQQTKSNFEEQKSLREEKKSELDQLEKQLVIQKGQLGEQIVQKENFLRDTQNDNARYQQLLAQAEAEGRAIQQAIITGSKIGPVKKGDPIALVGNSGYPGCSTGAHLHFEVRQNNTWVSPENYLSSKSVQDEQVGGTRNAGGGSWDWPLGDPIIITQDFGQTPWSWRYKYSGEIHTGIDMVSNGSQVIRAPADGTLFSSSQACGGSSNINIKYIEHDGGITSFYLHVQ